MTELYIGVMSGTSVDAVDASLVAIEGNSIQVLKTAESPIPKELRSRVIQLFEPSTNEIDRAFELGRELGYLFATTVNSLLEKTHHTYGDIVAIGCHGQTIRHRPNAKKAFTVQIGDAATLALETGIPVVHQFRQADVALGGQGAPLVPAFHQAAFHSPTINRCIVNIGGLGNITWLPTTGAVTGWDTGPGNGLMDAWAYENTGATFDEDGCWAASGETIPELLNQLLTHPYFKKTAPKSTGKEEFTPRWLKQFVQKSYRAEDVQATLLALTAQTISQDIQKLTPKPSEIILCGGGAYNSALVKMLKNLLSTVTISDSRHFGISPSSVESAAFAWLAKRFWHREPGNIPSVTGASRSAILGQLALP